MLFCSKGTEAVLTHKTLLTLWFVYDLAYGFFFHNTF